MEFENLIETFGNVRGAEIIKIILSFNANPLTDKEKTEAANLAKMFMVPNSTLFQRRYFFANNLARALLAQVLLENLQQHHRQLIAQGKEGEKEASALACILSQMILMEPKEQQKVDSSSNQ